VVTRVTRATIEQLIVEVARNLDEPTDLYLLGGATLVWLGTARSTLDIDFVGDDLPDHPSQLHMALTKAGDILHLDVEAVPIERFVPPLKGSSTRHRLLASQGALRVWMFDPLTLALSKLDRGLASDVEDLQFMLATNIIALEQLHLAVEEVAPSAAAFDMDLRAMRRRLDALRDSK
jgi:hypothetical protein